MGLTSEDKKAVLDSWAKMSGPTFQDAGEKVFLLLLKTDSTKALFPKFRDIPYDQLAGHPDVRDHGGKVMQVLDDFIKGLDNGGDGAVQKVGLLHKGVGVTHDNINLHCLRVICVRGLISAATRLAAKITMYRASCKTDVGADVTNSLGHYWSLRDQMTYFELTEKQKKEQRHDHKTLYKKQVDACRFHGQLEIDKERAVEAAYGRVTSGAAGIYIAFELSSIRVHITEEEKSLGHLAVRLCGIIGGVYTTSGVLYSLVTTLTTQLFGKDPTVEELQETIITEGSVQEQEEA
uniref:Globin domain-containing protein n=1 Tax=Branchiostoma floridae TaxID=7739 RepID=C3Y5G3_BRAFL|eukprot:XP_002608200.1 hypothetical protein BRAFLDRAFT_90360 [Branchiostoma floridae]